MKIGVDCGVLGGENNSKAGNYQLCIRFLTALSRLDSQNQYYLYSMYPIPSCIMNSLSHNFTNIIVKPVKFWMQVSLSLELLKRPVNLFLGLNQALPYIIFCKKVVVVLDLAFYKYPAMFGSLNKIIWQTRSAVEKADFIITISNSTKNDLIKILHADKNKIKVIYLGY